MDFVAKRAALSATRRTTTYAAREAALQIAERTIRQLLRAALLSLPSIGRSTKKLEEKASKRCQSHGERGNH
jgi:hypothetical protein